MTGHRLLVVDDSPTVRKLVELTFRGTPWKVDYASTGSEALSQASRVLPDVILLDFILPDMRGIDVCRHLLKHEQTAHIPVVVMSGKESASELFRDVDSVFCCLAKPSTSEQIRAKVEAAAERRTAVDTTVAKNASFAQKEAAAQALYNVLKRAFANIPHWMNELGDKPPATFFARKVLTPQLTTDLLEALIPLLRDLLVPRDVAAPQQAALPGGASFGGQVDGWPVATLVTFFESSARTGSLTVSHADTETIAYLRGGEVVAVTSRDPSHYLRGARWPRMKAVPPEAMHAATEEQRRSATPVFVTLATSGHFPPGALTETLAAQSRRLLMAALEFESAAFAWRDLETLPAYFEAHGRHISTTRNTLRFGPDAPIGPEHSAEQRALEDLRNTPGQHGYDDTTVFARVRGFSTLVTQFSLSAIERQVLAVVDGQHNVQTLSELVGIECATVLEILARLAEVRLLCDANSIATSQSIRTSSPKPVMILEPDVDGFQQPLGHLLRNRNEPIALLSLPSGNGMFESIRRERPQAVFLNAGAVSTTEVLHMLEAHPELADVKFVLVLEPEMASRAGEFSSLGFNRILVKPIARTEIEELFP